MTDVDITSLPAQDVEELTYFAGYLKHRYANFEDHVKKTNLIKMIQRLDDVEPQQENINISDAIEAIYIGGSQQKKID